MRITKQHHQPKALHSLAVAPWFKQKTHHSVEVLQAVSDLSYQKSRKTAGMERRYTAQRHAQGGDEPNGKLVNDG